MKVSEYMSTDVFTANLGDGLRQTFYRMREREIRHMPVIDADGRLVGIISDRDLRRPDWVDDEENVAHFYLLDNAHKVKDTMTPGPTVIHQNAPVIEAVEIFVERRFGALPVVDDEERLVGMISALDLLRAYRDSAPD